MLAEELEATLRAFQESRVLLTAIELDVFAAVEGGATADDVAQRLGLEPRATEMLLNALAAMELLSKRDGRFSNQPVANELLSPNARQAMLHNAHRWHTWSTLTDRVRGTAPAEVHRTLDSGRHESLLEMLNRRAGKRAPRLLNAIGAEGVHRLLDIGGGSAAYSVAFAEANADLRADVFDLPEVIPITKRYIAAAGFEGRVRAVPGDLLTDELGSGYDLILLFSLAHLLSEEQNRGLFERCHRALAPGGRVAIHDHILAADKTSPHAGALFALNMLVATPGGATYSFDEYAAWLRDAGFREVERKEIEGPTDVVIGRR